MFKLLLLLILRLDVLIAPESDNTSTSSKTTQRNILPLVLIRTEERELLHPTQLPFPFTDNDGNFLFGTTFTAEKDGKQLFFCGQGPSKEDTKMAIDEGSSASDNRYCLSELSESENGSNYLQCPHEPEPFVQKLIKKENSKEGVSCGSLFNQMGEMFAFVYEVKAIGDNKASIFELYRFCFIEKMNIVLFTEHTIAAPRFLDPDNDLFNRERIQTYEMSTESYHFFDKKYELIKKAYEEHEQLKAQPVQPTQPTQPTQPIKKRSREEYEKSLMTNKLFLSGQKLVPTEDMAFALWKKTTFHFLNFRPMEDKKIELWDYINQLIREDAINKSREYHIRTGAFDLTAEGKNIKELIQSPDLWMKVVHYIWQNGNEKRDESIAIVLSHNPDIDFIKRSMKVICEENLCQDAFLPKFPDVGKSVCCARSEKVEFYFDLELKHHENLQIDSFFNQK